MDNFFLMGLLVFRLGSGTDRHNKKVEPSIVTSLLFVRAGLPKIKNKGSVNRSTEESIVKNNTIQQEHSSSHYPYNLW